MGSRKVKYIYIYIFKTADPSLLEKKKIKKKRENTVRTVRTSGNIWLVTSLKLVSL